MGLQVCRYQGREWDWEVVSRAKSSKTPLTGDAKEGRGPRPPTALCQESGLDMNLQGNHVFYIAY